jgi:hypothetical protein
MRKLKTSIFGYPIYTVTTTYHYRKVGVPTVFEELLMSLAAEFPQLKQKSIGQIAKVLKLEPTFIRHTLSTMKDIGMINLDDTENLEELAIANLTLTDTGKQFYQSKKVPGRRRTAITEFYFNPVSQKYDKLNKASKIDISFEQSLFSIDETLLPTLSRNEVESQQWFDSDVALEDNGITHYIEQENFQSVPVTLSLDDNFHLQLDSSDKLFNEWIKTRSSDILETNILKPLLSAPNKILNEHIIELENSDNYEILSLVLADQKSDLTKVENTITVQLLDAQNIAKNIPALILSSNSTNAALEGKHLSIPNPLSINDSITQLFFQFNSDNIFIEEVGSLLCYFDHQPYHLPVKRLSKQQGNWIINLPTFISPNNDTLIFLANFIQEDVLLAKLPIMNLSQAVQFHKDVVKTWNKEFMPKLWTEKISPISNEKELQEFIEYFNHASLSLKQITNELQFSLFDLGIKNSKSPIRKIVELVELFDMYDSLKLLDFEHWDLKIINLDTLNKIQYWQNACDKLRINYPNFYSQTLQQFSEKLLTWEQKIRKIFKLQQSKFAILDTNFIRKYSEKLPEIQTTHTVILPKVVLSELYFQKEKNRKEIDNVKEELNQHNILHERELKVIGGFTEKIKAMNSSITTVEDELAELKKKLKGLVEEERNNGKE